MTPDQHDRVREIYEQALLIAGAAREQYLTRECADEAGIREAVERLLDAHGRVPDWLDRPLLGAAPALFAKLGGRLIGGLVGLRLSTVRPNEKAGLDAPPSRPPGAGMAPERPDGD